MSFPSRGRFTAPVLFCRLQTQISVRRSRFWFSVFLSPPPSSINSVSVLMCGGRVLLDLISWRLPVLTPWWLCYPNLRPSVLLSLRFPRSHPNQPIWFELVLGLRCECAGASFLCANFPDRTCLLVLAWCDEWSILIFLCRIDSSFPNSVLRANNFFIAMQYWPS
jgi:hypothetical protein